jgi:hypothetical protein
LQELAQSLDRRTPIALLGSMLLRFDNNYAIRSNTPVAELDQPLLEFRRQYCAIRTIKSKMDRR